MQIIGYGALVALLVLYTTEDVHVARVCVGYLKVAAALTTALLALTLSAAL